MLYFVVNNNFHLDNIEPFLKEIESYFIICFPHVLDPERLRPHKANLVVNTPFNNKKTFFRPRLFKNAIKSLSHLKFTQDDILVFQTEHDPLNIYTAYQVHQSGGQIVLLEEGIASYLNNDLAGVFTWKNRIKLLYIKYCLGMNYIDGVESGSVLFLRAPDHIIKRALFYFDARFTRRIEKRLVCSNVKYEEDLEEKKSLFLSQNLYMNYLSEQEYLDVIAKLLPELSRQFDETIFRFHPSESVNVKEKLSSMISNFSNIILDKNIHLNDTLKMYRPRYVISFFSTALLNLALSGFKPIFIYNQIPALSVFQVIKDIDRLLNELQYKQITNIKNIINPDSLDITPKSCEKFVDIIKGLENPSASHSR